MNEVAGPAAERIADLTWAMTALGALVFVVFCAAFAYALARRRSDEPPTPERDRHGTRAIVLFGALIPALILVPLFVWTVQALAALDPRAARPDLVIEVVGKQWWWEVRYRDADPRKVFMAANELHVPVGRRVELRLASTDVNHSFWVPALQGKTDNIPGRENVTWIEASAPGVYGGQCAEYCGTQHANMRLLVIAEPPAEWERWAARQREPAAEPPDSMARAGRDAFL
ncbi:MAG: cytochrome c oxidase subunit II, partial [Gemmatimonadota bacterium]|nr:cytochrome c oxidase subunit II [Gemmatimonadota bacterium]